MNLGILALALEGNMANPKTGAKKTFQETSSTGHHKQTNGRGKDQAQVSNSEGENHGNEDNLRILSY
jgi:hypothetical protein